ncbi:MAG: alkane 1-monooxygenase [Pseudomonadota bacterium]
MKGYTATTADGEAIHYVDRKRWFWLLSVAFPLQPFIAMILIAQTGNQAWVWLPFVLNYVVTPSLDWLIGKDPNNPPDEVVSQLEQDHYYRRLTYAIVPLHFVTLICTVWFATTQGLSWWAFIVFAIGSGMVGGLAINTAHELGHKNSPIEKLLAKIALAVPGYGHYTLEHNRGHHSTVSTFADPASSRMGESIYKFALREIPETFRNAWKMETERLAKRGKPAWHFDNNFLLSYAITLLMAIVFIIAFGWLAIPFLIIHNVMAYWQLTSANYIEHYGLLRKKDENGKIERCQPHHSWNCNYLLSNLVLFHLERHSDHHANPLRRYQSLKNYPDLPTLPNGYFGMYLLAYFPFLWFKVMDPKLMALPHVDGNLDNVNVDPDAHPSLFLKWGRDKMIEPTYTDLPGL